MTEPEAYRTAEVPVILPDDNDGLKACPNLLTEDELIRFLRIPDISKAQNYHNVIAHIKRYRTLPCVHICRQPLYPLQAVLGWIKEITRKEMAR